MATCPAVGATGAGDVFGMATCPVVGAMGAGDAFGMATCPAAGATGTGAAGPRRHGAVRKGALPWFALCSEERHGRRWGGMPCPRPRNRPLPVPWQGPRVQPRALGGERVFIPPVYELRVGILGVTHCLQPQVNHNSKFPVRLGKRGEGSVKREEELENVRERQQRL